MLHRDTVLVVDDSPETLGFLTDKLDNAEYTVLIATDAASALDLVDRITPDLVLMDATLRGMGGFELCRRLKRDRLLGDLPVIFMTGAGETERVVEGLAAGGVDYVVKPLMVDGLLARIRVHVGNARAVNSSRAALDATGRHLVAADRAGGLRWCTPRARELLREAQSGPDDRGNSLPVDLLEQLLRAQCDTTGAPTPSTLETGSGRLVFTFVGATGPDELLFCLTEADELDEDDVLQSALPLTAREAEVLLWISRGKANRDIGQILNVSPRTINKHLERIFDKLGVENRASATAQAVRALASRGYPLYAKASMPSWTMKLTTASRP